MLPVQDELRDYAYGGILRKIIVPCLNYTQGIQIFIK